MSYPELSNPKAVIIVAKLKLRQAWVKLREGFKKLEISGFGQNPPLYLNWKNDDEKRPEIRHIHTI